MSSINPEDVYAAVRAIPVGAVITYGDLAERVGLTRNHARVIGTVLANRPDNDAWITTPAEDHDIPWWRVVKADGTLRADQDDDNRRWIDRAKSVLVSEGVAFTDDGRVANLATGRRHPSGSGTRTSQAEPYRDPERCWKHETIQYSCRDCAPSR